MHIIRDWYRRHFTDPQVIILLLLLGVGAVFIFTLGNILTPVLASIVIAYVLDGLVNRLEGLRLPRFVALMVVYLAFLALMLFLLFGLLPKLSIQVGQIVRELPSIVTGGQQRIMRLPERYPGVISEQQVMTMIRIIENELSSLGQRLLAISVTWVHGLATFLVYLFLMPFMVFFFLKDKKLILDWLTGFLPDNRGLSSQVFKEVNRQISNYIRGKILEILIVWIVSYFTFLVLGLRFAMLISLAVGLSVLVPYIGLIVAALPVVMVASYQWGWEPATVHVMIAYTIIQLIDGNLLAPLLLSEVVDLHPVAIIVAVLTFGGLWGFWGVFFAIPLATLIEAVLRSWPGLARAVAEKIDQSDAT